MFICALALYFYKTILLQFYSLYYLNKLQEIERAHIILKFMCHFFNTIMSTMRDKCDTYYKIVFNVKIFIQWK